MTDIWSFHSAGRLVFGWGAAARVGELARELAVRRVLIITDRAIEAAGLVAAVRASLEQAGIAVAMFNGGTPEPAMAAVDEVLQVARSLAPEAVLGLGGGSNMDLAKITAVLLAHGGSVRDYVGDSRVPGPIVPVLCLPTTSGTGSEVTAAAVLTDTEQAVKVGILSNFMRPAVAVVDPQLTVSCPPKVTADSGIDALTHAVEAYTAVDNAEFPLPPGERTVYQGRHPLVAALAERAIALVGQHLARAVRAPDDRPAREGMALAATLAGLAFSNSGVALVHAMEYPVGGATHVSHGAGNGLLLPFVMRFNLPARPREMAAIARLLGADVGGLDERSAAEAGIAAVERLKHEIGIPARLRDLGVDQGQLRSFAEKAFSIKRILRVNPRPVTCDDIESIYQQAW